METSPLDPLTVVLWLKISSYNITLEGIIVIGCRVCTIDGTHMASSYLSVLWGSSPETSFLQAS